jgi:SHS2 domain-containing protein
MAKHCEPFDHPADVGLAAWADTLAELYEALAEGLAELICPRSAVRPTQSRTLEVRAEDREALAVDFLCAVLSAIQEDRFLVASASVTCEDAPPALRAVLCGEPYDQRRHELHIEVKAVTYHQLEIAQRAGRWHGKVLLDL